ncbi:MAG: CPBP family intramembrane glutamic endopeptidase [Actinomycetota bacterium]
MSARVEHRARDAGAATAIALSGLVVLLARPFVGGLSGGRVVLFAFAYAAIGLAAMAVPAATERPRLAPSIVLGLGLVSIAIAAIAAGSPVLAPWTSAALPLSLLAALAEEALFRRVLYARLLRLGAVAAITITAVVFAVVHLPAYGTAAIPVDFGAGLLFGWQRWASGTWTTPAITHGAANLLAVLR